MHMVNCHSLASVSEHRIRRTNSRVKLGIHPRTKIKLVSIGTSNPVFPDRAWETELVLSLNAATETLSPPLLD